MNCIIIDDEPMARKGMKRLVDTRPDLEVSGLFDSAVKAAKWLGENSVDLIFLDIEMPGLNGIDFARDIPEKCMVIFTTAYSEYALDGFEVDALDYLVKPIDPARFDKAVDRAVAYKTMLDEARNANDSPDMDFIIVKADRRFVRIKVDDIMYVEALKDYVIINLQDKRVITRMTMKAMEEMLPARRFLRVNKSNIANIDKIDSFDNNDIFIGSAEISIGLPYRDNVIGSLLG